MEKVAYKIEKIAVNGKIFGNQIDKFKGNEKIKRERRKLNKVLGQFEVDCRKICFFLV